MKNFAIQNMLSLIKPNMKNLKYILAAITLITGAPLLLPLASCSRYEGKEAARQREEWIKSIGDSITLISNERAADSTRLESLRNDIAGEIENFTTVNNPREVEPYYILKQYKSLYPLSSTGIAARILKDENLEIVAALAGKGFNALRVQSAGGSYTTSAVPHDQALNYTSGNLTTVAFSGADSDSLASFVADASGTPLTLVYLQNGVSQASKPLTEAQRNWIVQTAQLQKAQRECHSLEAGLLIASRKIEILKITLAEKQKD